MPMRIFLLTAAVLLMATESQAAQNPVRHGRVLAREFCGTCHAVGLRDRSRHAGAPPLRSLGQRIDLDRLPRMLERGISAAHPDMPQVKFSEEDARDLRAYLRSIQR
jgi:mono/diheme cytochrome c family protein